MKLIISAPHLDTTQRKTFEDNLDKAVPSISRRLGNQAPTDPILRGRLTQEGASQGGRVMHHLTLSIQLPDHPVVVHKVGEDIAALVDEGAKALKKDLRRACSRIRRDQLKRRRSSSREAFTAFTADVQGLPPLESAPLTAADMEANPIFARLRPLLGPLHNFARDHIEAAVSAGEIPGDYLSPEDLVDQAVIKTIDEDQAIIRSADELEQRLYRMIESMIAEEAERRHPGDNEMLSIEQRAPYDEQQGASLAGEDMEENEYYQPWTSLRLEDILIDEHADDPEHTMSDLEQRRVILKYLGSFPSKARSAFYLNRMEGFEPYEIAMIQSRTEDKVRQDIDKCVKTLQDGWSHLAGVRERHEEFQAPRPRRADVGKG